MRVSPGRAGTNTSNTLRSRYEGTQLRYVTLSSWSRGLDSGGILDVTTGGQHRRRLPPVCMVTGPGNAPGWRLYAANRREFHPDDERPRDPLYRPRRQPASGHSLRAGCQERRTEDDCRITTGREGPYGPA